MMTIVNMGADSFKKLNLKMNNLLKNIAYHIALCLKHQSVHLHNGWHNI